MEENTIQETPVVQENTEPVQENTEITELKKQIEELSKKYKDMENMNADLRAMNQTLARLVPTQAPTYKMKSYDEIENMDVEEQRELCRKYAIDSIKGVI